MFALTLFIICKVTKVNSNIYLNGCIFSQIHAYVRSHRAAVQTGFSLGELITHIVTMNEL